MYPGHVAGGMRRDMVAVEETRTKPAARRAAATRDPERTRAAILDAATQEFTANGLNGARVDAIAQRARVNKRMIYHYFGGKDGLYLAVLEAAYEAIRVAELELHLTDRDPADGMRELVLFTGAISSPIRNSSRCSAPRT